MVLNTSGWEKANTAINAEKNTRETGVRSDSMNDLLKGFNQYERTRRGYARHVRLSKNGWTTMPYKIIKQYKLEEAKTCSFFYKKKKEIAVVFYNNSFGNQKIRQGKNGYSSGFSIVGFVRTHPEFIGKYAPIDSCIEDEKTIVIFRQME